MKICISAVHVGSVNSCHHVGGNPAYKSELHKALFAPSGAPRVADDPAATFLVHANNIDGMVNIDARCTVGEDTAFVETPVGGINSNGKRPSSKDLFDHGFFPSRYSITIYDCDGEIQLGIIASGGCDFLRVEVVERDTTHSGEVGISNFWPTSLTAT